MKQMTEYQIINTQPIIDQFLERFDLRINGSLINNKSIKFVKEKSDLKFIEPQQQGCYFIFSTLKETDIPTFNNEKDAQEPYGAYKHIIKVNEKEFRCLYNGKGGHTRERLQQHLFNSHTLNKVNSKEARAKNISGTGAMSLTPVSQAELDDLQRKGAYDPGKHKLKPIRKSIHPKSHQQYPDKDYMLNGIDVSEPEWAGFDFAVCVIGTDTELGKILIEEAFVRVNGRPPLSKRYG